MDVIFPFGMKEDRIDKLDASLREKLIQKMNVAAKRQTKIAKDMKERMK